jgi:hypothetical protein
MYCGSSKDLTDEHIIPFGAGGDLVFCKSSCKDCAKITSKDELKVLRGFMYEGRLVGNAPSRRKKNKPKTINRILLRQDGTEFTKELLLSSGIAVIHLPIFTVPGVIFDRTASDGVEIKELGTLHLGMHNLSGLQKTENISGVRFNTKVDVISFCRVLCKIAYGYHVQKKGLFPRSESPALDIMLGKNTQIQHWLGSGDFEYPDSNGLHVLETTEIRRKDGLIMHMVYIKLFHGMGASSAYAVVTRICRE